MTTTPIISGFYPDPSICLAGDAYYIVNSSFEYLPGLPIHRSTDLLSWTPVGNALERSSQIAETTGAANTGVYAPTMRYREGRFWIIGTNWEDVVNGRGHFIISAADAAGPWSEPVFMADVVGIDPDLAWDDDGVCHVTWASIRPTGILSAPVDITTGDLLAEPKLLWQGTGGAHPEGPHLYRVDGWWYLLLAEGGTERGHMATIARARSLDVEFEPSPHNPLLTHRSSREPVQNIGHADLIQLTDGSWAVVHLGVRPRGVTPMFHVLGRETFIAGIDWIDGWPLVDEKRFDVPAVDHSFVDSFNRSELDGRWLGAGSFPASFTRWEADLGLVIDAKNPSPGQNLIATRVRDEVWSATCSVDTLEGRARFAVRVDDEHWYGFDVDEDSIQAKLAIGPAVSTIGHLLRLHDAGPVSLRIRAKEPVTSSYMGPDEPDIIELSALQADGREHVFGEFDGRYISTELAGGFTGRVLAVEALEGRIALREFAYRSGPDA